MSRTRRAIALLTALLLTLAPFAPASFADDSQAVVKVKAPETAKAVFAMDASTGKTLSSKGAGTARPVASTSKLMTVWLVHEKIAADEGEWADKVKITDARIDRMSTMKVYGGAVRLTKGRTFTVRQLYILTLVESNNAAAIMLGRWVAGNDRKFALRMNAAADDLGMDDSHFVNACGLNNIDYYNDLKIPYVGKRSDTNKMSARDAAGLACALVTEYPEILKTTGLARTKVKGKTIRSTNLILRDKKLKKKAAGLNIKGLKTGYIKRSGACLIATCKKKGRHRIITVVLNDKDRFVDTINLMKAIYKANPEAV